METNRQMKNTLPNLQILRFLAAAMVLLSHVQHQAAGMNFGAATYTPWTGIYLAGGVDIFFVISGFIMHAISSGDFGHEGAAKRFLIRRLVRIVPPYWLFTLAMIAAAVFFSGHIRHSALSLWHIVTSFLFIPYPNAYGQPYPMLMLGWTLNYEFFFYVVFGVALVLPRAKGLGFVFLAIGSLSVLGIFDTFKSLPMSFWSNPIMLEFLLGILLSMAHEKGARVGGVTAALLITGGFLAMFVLMDLGIAAHFWTARVLWMGLPALAICAGAVLLVQPVRYAGFKQALVFLGDASYALYLSHPFALNLVALLWSKAGLQQPYLYVALSCAVSLALGAVVHVLVEKPVTRYFSSRLSPKRAPGNAAQEVC
jgi:peptidoglycan/LPS O-acetylase OafA/YrhL